MKLEARTYTMDEWNDGIMPLVESGTLTEEKSKYPSFLMVYQKFAGTLTLRIKKCAHQLTSLRCLTTTIECMLYAVILNQILSSKK